MSIIMGVSVSVATSLGHFLEVRSTGVLDLCGLDWNSVLDDWVVERSGVFWLVVVVVVVSLILVDVLSFISLVVVLSIIMLVWLWLVWVSWTGSGVSGKVSLFSVSDLRGVLDWVWCSPGLVLRLVVVVSVSGMSMESLLNGGEMKGFLVLDLGGVDWHAMHWCWCVSVDWASVDSMSMVSQTGICFSMGGKVSVLGGLNLLT